MGVGAATQEKKHLETAAEAMSLITGQKPIITIARKAISAFRLREGMQIGCKVTLLGDACATRAQSYAGETVPARQVHAAFLAALNGFYAKVISACEL